MKKFHIAIAVNNLPDAIADYSKRLDAQPEVVIDDKYALWRTETLNFSIRVVPQQSGQVRHLGWEDNSAVSFTEEKDSTGLVWENFNAEQQREEIIEAWPDAFAQQKV